MKFFTTTSAAAVVAAAVVLVVAEAVMGDNSTDPNNSTDPINQDVGTLDVLLQPDLLRPRSSSCFSGTTQVVIPGGVKAISEVDAGDQVYVVDEEGQVRLDTVYLQAHKAPSVTADFMRLRTRGGRTLELSREHYVYVGGRMVQGQSVQVGDQVSVLDPSTTEMISDQVREVTVTKERGVYNPWTLSGHLLTSGVHSSAYSADTRPFSPAALHAIFWPLRQLTKMADITFQGTRLTEGQPEWMFALENILTSLKN